MRRLSPRLKALACGAAILPLAACSTLTPSLTKTGALEAFKPIRNSPQAPCEMQKEVADHNTVYDSLKTGKSVKYLAPCEVKQPEAKQPPKTS